MAEIDSTGRPAYVYNASDNKWYEVAGKVDPTANYNWTGTHTFSNPVTINNAVVISKRFNVFTNQTTRSAAMQTLGTTDRGHISFLQNDATSGSPVNRLEYWDGAAWATLVDPAITVTLAATQELTNKTIGSNNNIKSGVTLTNNGTISGGTINNFTVSGTISGTANFASTINGNISGISKYVRRHDGSGNETGQFKFHWHDPGGQPSYFIGGTDATNMYVYSPSNMSVGYASTSGNSNQLIGKNWYWSGQGGQPTWLWGGSDGTNMYVYNPSNFSVAYAGNSGALNGYGSSPNRDANSIVRRNEYGSILCNNLYLGDNGYIGSASGILQLEAGGNQIWSVTIRGNTTSSAANMFIGPGYSIQRSTSSYLIKENIVPLSNKTKLISTIPKEKLSDSPAFDYKKILNITPVSFISMLEDDDKKIKIGFIAQDVAQKAPEIATYDENDQPDFYDSNSIIACLLAVIQDQQSDIEKLKIAVGV